jgi:adenylate cyclase class IV
MSDFDLSRLLESLSGRKKPVVHELKWKIPESRSSAPLEDAETIVAQLRKTCAFKSGGEYYDTVYTKEYGDGVFAYFLVRTDKRTEKETLVFDGYMVQEEDEKLGLNLETGFEMMRNLASMGYKQEFSREVTEWNFTYHLLSVSVFDIADFGAFIQVSMPATKIESSRRLAEKSQDAFFAKMKVQKRDIIPTDVITLQVMLSRQAAEEQKQKVPKIGMTTPLKKSSADAKSLF